ncbi:MAG: class I SAM-dependent methyltransferase, partial [Acidimicrobiales bacterium]
MAAGSARYDEVADFYISGQPETFDAEMDIALLDLVGAIDGARVLDLACGHGRIARELARRGAHVVGVDLAKELITRAQQAERAGPLGIDYLLDDAARPGLLSGYRFDIVVANFGLSDIDDFDGALRNVHRLLSAGGRFVFLILHPCFPGRGPSVAAAWAPDAGYYTEGFWITDAPNSGLRQKVGANHRTLSTYLNRLLDLGFVIDRIAEPTPPDAWNAATPDLEPVPTILIVRAIKPRR